VSVKLSRIAQHLGCSCDPVQADVDIQGIADPKSADERSITFVSSRKYLPLAQGSRACAVIVSPGCTVVGKILLEVKNPYLGFAKVAQLFEDRSPLFDGPIHPTCSIHPSAVVHPSVFAGPHCVVGNGCRIGRGTILGALCVVENDSVIGEDCRIDSGAIVRRRCVIGNRVIIQSGAVIGGEGFGNARDDGGKWERIPSFGAVIVGDDAEIGANTTIDRGTLEPTVIGAGVKIDNLVMVAHNVTVGDHTAIAAQTGLSGSTSIGKRVMIGGQAGFAGHLTVGDDAFVGAQAGVAKVVDKGEKVTGSPARGLMAQRRVEAAQLQLPELLKEVKRLRGDLKDLKARFDAKGENVPEL
jgi:UDP-3-O-[3-hydroxymyristoyl] glucosamine N-acyltransferase